jgi:hypothetical protein
VILRCTFEELSALQAGAERVLAEASSGAAVVTAPPEVVAEVEALMPRLTGDLSLFTLADQRRVAGAIGFIVNELKQRMDIMLLEQHPASEYAVQAYFEYAHALRVQYRANRIGFEMAAMIELMTGKAATAEASRKITFPD